VGQIHRRKKYRGKNTARSYNVIDERGKKEEKKFASMPRWQSSRTRSGVLAKRMRSPKTGGSWSYPWTGENWGGRKKKWGRVGGRRKSWGGGAGRRGRALILGNPPKDY